MVQATDIVLDGAGYMLAPGSYQRTQDGMAEGRTGRVVVRDFFGGQRRAYQLERDRSWDSPGVGPAYGGQGVEPWPLFTANADPVLAPVNAIQRLPHVILGNNAYVANGQYLYRSVGLTAGTWGSLTRVADAGAGQGISRLAVYRGDLLLLLGAGGDVLRYATATGTVTTFAPGLKAGVGIGYARQLLSNDPTTGNDDTVKMTTGAGPDQRELDAPIVQMGLHESKAVIATRRSLWLLDGRPDPTTNLWTRDPQPFFSHGVWATDDDFLFLLSFGGKLYTWLSNSVMVWDPATARQGWKATGLEGDRCQGATVAGNMLVVCCTTRAGNSETWAWDGSGWWLLLRATAPIRCWPMALNGAGSYDLAVFRDGASTHDLYRMIWRSASQHSYAGGGTFLTSLLDAGERDKDKAWRAIGASFAVPEPRGNQGSTDAVTVALDWSTDGGQTFTTGATATASDPTARVLDLEAALSSGAARGHWLQVRVRWSSVLDWAPVLVGVWAEYELLDAPARRRRWRFAVLARDATVQRDGSRAARTGRQLAADLWAAWETGTTLPFQDLDTDETGITRQVRIVGLAEEVAKPADAGRWGERTLTLTLVEV